MQLVVVRAKSQLNRMVIMTITVFLTWKSNLDPPQYPPVEPHMPIIRPLYPALRIAKAVSGPSRLTRSRPYGGRGVEGVVVTE